MIRTPSFALALERALHLHLLHRGLLVTPFHNMWLAAPQTTAPDVERLVDTLAGFLAAVRA